MKTLVIILIAVICSVGAVGAVQFISSNQIVSEIIIPPISKTISNSVLPVNCAEQLDRFMLKQEPVDYYTQRGEYYDRAIKGTEIAISFWENNCEKSITQWQDDSYYIKDRLRDLDKITLFLTTDKEKKLNDLSQGLQTLKDAKEDWGNRP